MLYYFPLQRYLQCCRSDYQLEQSLKKEAVIKGATEFVINSQIQPVHHNGVLCYDVKQSQGIKMPLKFQLKKLFEKDNFIIEMLDFMKAVEQSPIMKNFIQGEL